MERMIPAVSSRGAIAGAIYAALSNMPSIDISDLRQPVERHDHTNRRKYIGARPSNNIYGRCKAMARKKPRPHLESDMRNMAGWTPRYPNC